MYKTVRRFDWEKKEELWKLCSEFMAEHELEPRSDNALTCDHPDVADVYELVEKICTLIGWSSDK